MIEGIVGRPGAGKSLYGVVRLLRAHRFNRPAYSNLYPRWKDTWKWSNWEGMKEGGEGLFVIDEAQIWFNSRTFANNTSELVNWQQSRKRGADLIWIAQHENRVDTAIRELTSIIWEPRQIGPVTIVKGKTMEGERAGLDIFLHKLHYGAYHTDQIIGTREDTKATLARVVAPTLLDTPLYAQSPTHAVVNGRWQEYTDHLSAEAYFYRDYEGSYHCLEADQIGWRVTDTVESPRMALIKALRVAAARRDVAGKRLIIQALETAPVK